MIQAYCQVPRWGDGARRNEILWEVPDGLRDLLADSREPGYAGSQMNAFELADGRLRQVAISAAATSSNQGNLD